MRKCKCGNQVARNAKFCPQCGHRFASRAVKFLAGFCGLIILIAIIGAVASQDDQSSQPPLSLAQQAAQQKNREASRTQTKAALEAYASVATAVSGETELQRKLLNPSSLTFNCDRCGVVAESNGAVCYLFNAENRFGSLTEGAAVRLPQGGLWIVDMAGGDASWIPFNKYCNKPGRNLNQYFTSPF